MANQIDPKQFKSAKEIPVINDLSQLSSEERERLRLLGLDEKKPHEGEYLQIDSKAVLCQKKVEGLEILPITEAMKTVKDFEKYYWKALSPEKDEFTKLTSEELDDGYFIRVLPGYKLTHPVQTCLYIRTENIAQKVHNIVIVEEEAELNLLTSCTVHPHLGSALHVGVSEYYVKRGGKLTFTMVHMWGDKTVVRPRTGVLVEEKGIYISTYVSLFPVKNIQTAPICKLLGEELRPPL